MCVCYISILFLKLQFQTLTSRHCTPPPPYAMQHEVHKKILDEVEALRAEESHLRERLKATDASNRTLSRDASEGAEARAALEHARADIARLRSAVAEGEGVIARLRGVAESHRGCEDLIRGLSAERQKWVEEAEAIGRERHFLNNQLEALKIERAGMRAERDVALMQGVEASRLNEELQSAKRESALLVLRAHSPN